jgi:hypothetical protein
MWPPDVFAVAAALIELSGCYAHARYSGRSKGPGLFGERYLKDVRQAASLWRRDLHPPAAARDAWRTLAECEHPVGRSIAASQEWRDAAVRLLAIADEACAGVGFRAASGSFPFADFVLSAHREYLASGERLLPHLPNSLCVMVPASEACVLPKTRTAQVGCTLRAMSHHLALLPADGHVAARWHTSLSLEKQTGDFHLLLVPYPYRIRDEAFVRGRRIKDESRSAHFTLRHEWLERIGRRADRVRELTRFIKDLLSESRRAGREVNGIVLPEGVLDERAAREIAASLASTRHLEIFIAGVTSPPARPEGAFRNRAYASLYFKGNSLEWFQSKHHRWCLDEWQISRYGLGGVLPKALRWWEDIDISKREVNFYVFRPGASIAVLVCEDLARVDPVQPVVRAVGPTLVVSLLLDGAQEERRWPGRYATVLADDPGSAVLTLTSLGMIRRSMGPGESRAMPVALWKDSAGPATELGLPQGSHALLLTLRTLNEENWTLDGRSDRKATVRLKLVEKREITHPAPPPWV